MAHENKQWPCASLQNMWDCHDPDTRLESMNEKGRIVALCALFWIVVMFNQNIDLIDTTGLNRRETVVRCQESVMSQSGTQPEPSPTPA